MKRTTSTQLATKKNLLVELVDHVQGKEFVVVILVEPGALEIE